MLKITNLNKKINSQIILDDINLQVNKNEVVSIIGKSGAGKTSILRIIDALEKADDGIMTFNNKIYNLKKLSRKDILEIRQNVGFVFQDFNLFLNKTALENVLEGLIVVKKMNKLEAIEISKNCLNKVGLQNKYDSYPHELSGGQKQRVGIARAIALSPQIILFDEPTSALDPELIDEVLNVIKDLALSGMTMIIVSHELHFVKSISDKVYFMENGKILEFGSTNDIFNNPKNQRTHDFITHSIENHV